MVEPETEIHTPAGRPQSSAMLRRQASVDRPPLSRASHPPSEPRSTDLTPDQRRRALFSSGAGFSPVRSFASIMHKFVRDDAEATPTKPNHKDDATLTFQNNCKKSNTQRPNNYVAAACDSSNNPVHIQEDGHADMFPNYDLLSVIPGPETPDMQPLVPRLKRIQQDHFGTNTMQQAIPFASPKRLKTISKDNDKTFDSPASKFEWLNPSFIKDSIGRRPDDPLYNKSTLHIPTDVLKKMSPSQKQYWSVKSQYMDVVLFFKVGKFYELYELDAEIGQKELDWKMTISGVGKCRQVGISEAGIDDAVQKLTSRGYKVGRMEQLETADQAKARGASSVIERKLVLVSTPSTPSDGVVGPDAIHLLALKEGSRDAENRCTTYGFAFFDSAVLKFWVGSISDDDSHAALGALLMQVSPKETLYESKGLLKETHKALIKYASAGSSSMQLTPSTPALDCVNASDVMEHIHSKGYFRGSSNIWTSAFDNHNSIAVCALGILISHLCRMMLNDALLNGELLPYHVFKSCLRMDGQTLVNLEIFSNNIDGGLSGTLYKHLDHCIIPSGKRLLRRWICHPLKEIDEINNRLNVVEGLIKDSALNSIIGEYLRRLPDLERLLGRVRSTVGSSASLLLRLMGERLLKRRIKTFVSLIKGLRIGIDLLIHLRGENHCIPSLLKFVDLSAVDVLHVALKQFEEAVDEDFPQYQNNAVEESYAGTLSVLIDLFIEKAAEWSSVIHALSCIDVLQSFAATAISSYGSMCKPLLLQANSINQTCRSPVLHIKGLWHPYAAGENGNNIVPNDLDLGEDPSASHPCTLLLTGPNMGGKSTLLRATCLAVILAQLGCYVPCDKCVMTPADTIFTRLGATDRIMSGESTFYVECSETASVLQSATPDSLVLLDELGRGTSTFDGYAIAYAVFRHLVEKVGCRLLFATHYHSLTKEFATHPQVSLQHMACAFKPKRGSLGDGEKELVFLYRLASGACPESYGLQVALMAGIPKTVVGAASEAALKMKMMISKNFTSSEGRSSFSTLHEQWLKSLLTLARTKDYLEEDASDTLLCLWHEISSYKSGK